MINCKVLFCSLFSVCCISLCANAEEANMGKVGLGSPAQLKIALTPEARCNFGDLDVITLDMESGEAKLQLTVEEFGGNGQVFYGKPVEEKDAGYNFTVDLPAYKKPALFGLYLCSVKKDSENIPCGTFPAKSYKELIAPYTVDITRAKVKDGKLGSAPLTNQGKNDPTGKIYFFKHFLLDGKGNVEFPSTRMNEERYKDITSYISNNGGKLDNADWQITRLKLLGAALGSEPLTVKDNKIISCTLPFYDKKKCTGN